jgi:tetratricopeptide (TPR) repeat protein
MRRCALLLVAAVALAARAVPAIADDLETCKSGSKEDAAIAACSRVISDGKLTGADLAEIYYERGMKFRYKQRYDSSIRDFTAAIGLDPSWPWPYVARGHAYAYKREFQKAFADQEKAIGLDKTEVTLTGRAIDLMEAGAYDLALKDIDEALQLNPKYFYAHYNRGEIYRRMGRFDLAETSYNAALEIRPGDDNAQSGLASARKRVRD